MGRGGHVAISSTGTSGASAGSGNRVTNRAPPPGARSARTSPPCARAIARQIASPNPTPPIAPSMRPRWNFSNNDSGSTSGGKPGPLSTTESSHLVIAPPRTDDDAAAAGRVLGGVLEQVEQQLLEQHRVRVDQRRCVVEARLDHVVGQQALQPLQCGADDFLQRDPFRLRDRWSGFQPRHVEHVGNQLGHLRRLIDDALRQLAPRVGRQPRVRLRQAARRAADHRQRRTHVVRDRRQQAVAHRFGLGGDRRRLRLFGQARALERERELAGEGVEQMRLLGQQDAARIRRQHGEHARARGARHRCRSAADNARGFRAACSCRALQAARAPAPTARPTHRHRAAMPAPAANAAAAARRAHRAAGRLPATRRPRRCAARPRAPCRRRHARDASSRLIAYSKAVRRSR